MIRLLFLEPDAKKRAMNAQETLRRAIMDGHLQANVFAAPTLFGGGRIWHVLLRGKDVRKLLSLIETWECSVDVDPMDTL